MSGLKLTYFNVKSVAETTRVMLHAAGVEFTDDRVYTDFSEDGMPAKSQEFYRLQAEGVFYMNLDRLPLLTITDTPVSQEPVVIGQSKTIERFVAKKIGFFGSNDVEAALIDMICEHVRDIIQAYHSSAKAGLTGDALKEAKAAFLTTELLTWFAKLEKTIPNGTPFAVGEKMSLADVTIHQLVKDYFPASDSEAALAAVNRDFPKIAAAVAAVADKAASYLATRPVTPF